ncbi:hypothetical protein, partial [Mycolicibacterium phlei]|uniref:hypothetical protein n=1 Tax=Mycolicibacterium phlei TaxID=1771 RepID=UPI001B870278
KDTKNWHPKKPRPKREKRRGKKTTNKTTKHTIEFSNNTPGLLSGNPASLYRSDQGRQDPVPSPSASGLGPLGLWLEE